MRIGLFTDAYLPDINGVVSSVATLKHALEELGHTVFIITNHKGVKIAEDEDGHILRLPGLEIKKFYGYKMSSPVQFTADAYIEKMDLDVIHIQTEAGVGMFGRQMAKVLHIPIVYTYHTMYEDYTHYFNPLEFDSVEKLGKSFIRAFSRVLANGSQAVIAPSEKTKQALIQYGVMAPIYIVPTGLDLSEYDRKNLDETRVKRIREELGFSQEDHIVVFVGRIAKEKAIEIPIEAICKNKDPHLHLVIVGGGTDMEYYQDLAKKYNVENRVHFTGKIPKEDIAYYYQPIVSAVTGKIRALEALMHVEMSMLKSPEDVLCLAKEEKCLHDLERITFFCAAEGYCRLRANGKVRGDELLFVNSIASENMTDEECREFRQRYLDIRSQLVLEITEQELLSKEALERKTSKGFLGAVALDDYGSGYNSEKSLLALSPKYIKVDMVIIRDIDTDIDKQQIVANIVKYAHQRGMYIVAEGVETAEELKKVLELEVDLLQGYYLSRPAATPGAINPDALKIIEENRKR